MPSFMNYNRFNVSTFSPLIVSNEDWWYTFIRDGHFLWHFKLTNYEPACCINCQHCLKDNAFKPDHSWCNLKKWIIEDHEYETLLSTSLFNMTLRNLCDFHPSYVMFTPPMWHSPLQIQIKPYLETYVRLSPLLCGVHPSRYR